MSLESNEASMKTALEPFLESVCRAEIDLLIGPSARCPNREVDSEAFSKSVPLWKFSLFGD